MSVDQELGITTHVEGALIEDFVHCVREHGNRLVSVERYVFVRLLDVLSFGVRVAGLERLEFLNESLEFVFVVDDFGDEREVLDCLGCGAAHAAIIVSKCVEIQLAQSLPMGGCFVSSALLNRGTAAG